MNKLSLFFICLFSSIQIFAQSNIPSYVPTNGLVGWWPFNGNANDESGNGNNGTVNGATLTSDRFGNVGRAYSFDGVNDFINGSVSNFSNTSKSTLAVWLRCTGDAAGLPYDMFFQYGLIGTHTFTYSYNYSNAQFDLSSRCFTSPYSIPKEIRNGWHHFIITDSLDLTTVYVDGILISNITSGDFNNCYAGSNEFLIGGENDPIENQYFTGSLDDIAIYNRALTPQEITALYQGSSTQNNTGGNLGINTNTPHPSAALDITDTQRGLLIPRMTATQRNSISNPAEGLMVYQTNETSGFWYFNGVDWSNINSQGIQGPQGPQGIQGPQGEQGIQGLQGAPGNGFQNGTANGQLLYWKDSAWITVSPGTNGQTLTLCNGVPHWGPCPVDTIPSTLVTIGSQIWENKNLSTSTYNNGDPIPHVTDSAQWASLTTGAWCWYNNDSATYWQYGKLYNWFAVNDPRGLAPSGWHVSTEDDWSKLVKFLDPNADTTLNGWQNTNAGGMLKSTTLWNSPNTGATNSIGFGALPAGRRFSSGIFNRIGDFGYFWTSTENDASFAKYRYMSNASSDIHRFFFNKVVGFSVRLVKD